ncbi:31430_t:CDS:1, partial [Gigaspora margarita]
MSNWLLTNERATIRAVKKKIAQTILFKIILNKIIQVNATNSNETCLEKSILNVEFDDMDNNDNST